MNILVSINRPYIKYFLTMINSLSKSNEEETFDIYIMYSNLDDKDKELINSQCPINMTFHYIFMHEELFNNSPKDKRYPHEIYYRIFAAKYLPNNLDRVLYLDSDLIVHKSIKELYNIDFENNLFAGCTQIRKMLNTLNKWRLGVKGQKIYLNTGVLLMNLVELRKILNEDEIMQYININGWRMILFDQDVIFKFYGDRVKLLDKYIYNLSDRHIKLHNLHSKTKIDLNWVENNNVIIHYLGKNKPWKDNYNGILQGYYKKYEVKL